MQRPSHDGVWWLVGVFFFIGVLGVQLHGRASYSTTVLYQSHRVDDFDRVSASDSESMETSVELSGVSDGAKKPGKDEEVSTEEES